AHGMATQPSAVNLSVNPRDPPVIAQPKIQTPNTIARESPGSPAEQVPSVEL
ncbi:hypothetical protein P7K49_017113, partial [Saguinus oedipus]